MYYLHRSKDESQDVNFTRNEIKLHVRGFVSGFFKDQRETFSRETSLKEFDGYRKRDELLKKDIYIRVSLGIPKRPPFLGKLL